jgi:hypothetical protein
LLERQCWRNRHNRDDSHGRNSLPEHVVNLAAAGR